MTKRFIPFENQPIGPITAVGRTAAARRSTFLQVLNWTVVRTEQITIKITAPTPSEKPRLSIGRFRSPDLVEKQWSELASSRRNFLPLLGAPLAHPMGEGSGVRARESGERERVRAGFSVRPTSMNPSSQSAKSGVLRPRSTQTTCEKHRSATRHRSPCGRRWIGLLAALLSLIPAATGAVPDKPAAPIADRTAIERVYFAHRLGNKPSFEQALPATAIEKLVRRDLKKEAVLKWVYGVEPQRETVEAEVRRIDAESRAPEILAEIKAALGNDPIRFARSMARPIVVDRELRHRFEMDDRLHAAQREQADSVRQKILAKWRQTDSWQAMLQTLKETKVGTVTEVTCQFGARPAAESSQTAPGRIESPVHVKASSGKYSLEATAQIAQVLTPPDSAKQADQPFYFEDLSAELKSVLRAQLEKPGDISAVMETPTGFLLFVAKERTQSVLSAAQLSIPKRSFEQWLAEQND